MKATTSLYLLLLVLPLMASGNKRRQKNHSSPPHWKPSSMPAMNKRFESVYEGASLNLDCKAQSEPKPRVKWLKDGVELRSRNNVEVKKFNLALKLMTTDMSGNYTCVVSNKHGQLNWTFHLDVQLKLWPLIIEGPNNITQMAGSNVAFRCQVINDPRATIRWQKIHSYGSTDDSKSQADFLPDGPDPRTLNLDNIQRGHEGEYRCMAGNVWGLKHSSAWLTVIEPVLIPDVPRMSEMDRKRGRNNINNNNIVENNSQEEFDPLNPNELDDTDDDDDDDNSIFDSRFGGGDLNPSDHDHGLYFTTTKRPKNRNNNRKKNERRKDKKGKERTQMEDAVTTTTMTSEKQQKTTTKTEMSRSTYPEIWRYEYGDNYHEPSDTRYNPIKTNDEEIKDVAEDSNNSQEDTYLEGSISLWTIYTVVGAVGAVILLIGLVAITLTVCCKREETSIYKSTPV